MLVFISSLAVFLASIILAGAVKALPPAELRRQARSGKKGQTVSIYKLVSYGSSLDIFLGVLVISSFIGSILAAAEISWWLVVGVFLMSLLVWLKDPNGKSGKVSWSIAGYLAYPANWLLSVMNPIFRRLAMVSRRRPAYPHTRAYAKEDLLELLKHQAQQADNRIDESDLKIARAALTFGDKSTGSVMTPRRVAKMVSATEPIGPHLMDELHVSGQTSFPVVEDLVKTSSPEIIGTLYLKDIIGQPETGKVKDVMSRSVHYINESQTLREALSAILKTRSHLLIVVNNFEEFVGTLSLDEITKQIVGELPDDEFEHHDKLHLVAGRGPKTPDTSGKSVVK